MQYNNERAWLFDSNRPKKIMKDNLRREAMLPNLPLLFCLGASSSCLIFVCHLPQQGTNQRVMSMQRWACSSRKNPLQHSASNSKAQSGCLNLNQRNFMSGNPTAFLKFLLLFHIAYHDSRWQCQGQNQTSNLNFFEQSTIPTIW